MGSAVVLFCALTRTRTTKRTYPFKPRVIGVQVAPACATQWQHICEAALCRETSAEVKISSHTLHPSLRPAPKPIRPAFQQLLRRSVQVSISSEAFSSCSTSTAGLTQRPQAKTYVETVHREVCLSSSLCESSQGARKNRLWGKNPVPRNRSSTRASLG